MQTHDLKIIPPFFDDVANGDKTFELREDDRGYRVGDTLLLREYQPNTKTFTGRTVRVRVEFLLQGASFGLREGWVCMAIRLLSAGT